MTHPVVSADRPRFAVLTVFLGDQDLSFRLAPGEHAILGREVARGMLVPHESVSRRHALLSFRDNRLTVRDLGSTNGTYVNGRLAEEEIVLGSGDVLRFGEITAIAGIAERLLTAHRRVYISAAFHERLEEEVHRAHHFDRSLGLLVVRCEETGSAPNVLCTLAQLTRGVDIVAEYALDELIILSPEMGKDQVEKSAARIAAELERCGIAHAIGCAAFPEHGSTPTEVLDGARRALERARTNPGGSRIATLERVDIEGRAQASPVISSLAMRKVFQLAEQVAPTELAVLITGETGVGKELVAEAIHRTSKRSSGPLLRINCTALPPSLLESELFGHEKGSFSGAMNRKPGLFESAAGGTLLLDEIGEVSESLQVKLLRVIESKRVVRVGGTEEIDVDFRVVASTNRDLEKAVSEGRFREDLYYRLDVFHIHVPPLRERPEEIVPLAQRFAVDFCFVHGWTLPRISPKAEMLLREYPWPGNVRELRHVIESAIVLAEGEEISERHLPSRLLGKEEHQAQATLPGVGQLAPPAGTADVPFRDQMAELERRQILQALAEAGHSRTEAARRMGVSRRTLHYKMKKLGITPGK